MGIFDASSLPSGPTSQSIHTSGIAPCAQSYVLDYLNRAQQLSSQGPSAQQQQVYNAAQNMQTPGQFAQGAGLAQQGGEGSLSTAPMALGYGQLGANIGQLGAGIGAQGIGLGAQGQQYGMNAGANYAQQATNPYAVGAYMNPFIQQALAPQMELLNQQQQLGSQNIAAKAVGQGAFGGNRATLAQGLNNQNYALAKQQAMGQAYTDAYKQAQQAQQFGSTLGLQGAMQGTQLGLQGLGTALQGAGLGIQGAQAGLQGVSGAQQGYQGATQAGAALGNIGSQQGQYGLGQLALQNQIANQQYNLPYQNLQFMQGMMGGLPVSTSTTQGYQAPPNSLSQIAGLGATAAGVYGMGKNAGWWGGNTGGSNGAALGEVWGSPGVTDTTYGAGTAYNAMTAGETANMMANGIAKGGHIKDGNVKRYAKGGKVNYSTGGDINLIPTEKLAPMMQNPNISPMDAALIQEELIIRSRMKGNPQTAQIMGGGLDTIPSGDMFRAAGGGIVAFSGDTDGSLVKTRESYSTPKQIRPEIKDYQSLLEQQIRDSLEKTDSNSYARSQAMQEDYAKAMKERQSNRPVEALLNFGLGALAGESPYAMTNLGKAGTYALQQEQKAALEDVADRKLMLQQQVEQEKSADARQTARQNAMQTSLGQMYTREIGLKNAGASAATAAASKAQTEYNKNWNNFQHAIALEKNNLMNQKSKTFDYEQNPSKLDADAYTNVYNKMPPSILSDLKLPDPKAYQARAEGTPAAPVVPAAPAKPAEKTNYLPMPQSAAEAVVGKIYNTARGPAKWDGKKFIPI
jgi:hypothetical protein